MARNKVKTGQADTGEKCGGIIKLTKARAKDIAASRKHEGLPELRRIRCKKCGHWHLTK